MVTVLDKRITAIPNCSASWNHNKWLIAAVASWSLLMAIFFYRQGAWLMVPILSFEVAMLALVLTVVCKKIHQRHVLRFQQENISIEKTGYCPTLHWQLSLQHTAISVERQAHPWSPLKINLCAPGENIPIGDFLNREDSNTLLTELRQQGLPVCNDSPADTLQV